MDYPPMSRDPYGRFRVWPVPEMVEFGLVIRRARRMAGLTQHELARRSTVSQSTICRLEKGLVPGMATWKLVKIAMGIGAWLPMGFCPHDHDCSYPKYATERLRHMEPTPGPVSEITY